jgi:hypothetical protein
VEKRVGIEWLQERLPHSKRALQAMAARGDIPSAGKVGALWTFDPVILGRWIRRQVEQACQTTSKSDLTASYTFAPRFEEKSIDEAYERAIGLKPRNEPARSGRRSKSSGGLVRA